MSTTSAQLRNAALSKASGTQAKADPLWHTKATACVIAYLKNQEVTGEDIRNLLAQHGLSPVHNNVIGAFVNSLARQGVLVDTGKITRMKTHKSHARRTPLWRVQKPLNLT